MDPMKVIVSACLVGVETRYDGTASPSAAAVNALSGCGAVPVCPEQLGGLPTPRPCATISGGTGTDVLAGAAAVRDDTGGDVTASFVRGAENVLKIARLTGAGRAFLKEKSPSCGVGLVHTEEGGLERGSGVTAALLAGEGIECTGFDED